MALDMRAPGWGRPLLAINAVVAWCAVAFSGYLSISGYYLGKEDPSKLSLLGNLASGHDQWYERLFDWATYFTIWSNVTVAVVLTVGGHGHLHTTMAARTPTVASVITLK